MEGSIKTDVKDCPLCGQAHPALKFRTTPRLKSHNCFATCPETKEPLLANLRLEIDRAEDPKNPAGLS